MTKITKEQVLENLEDVNEAEGIAIKNRSTEEIIFQSTKTTWKEAVEEAVENYANLHDADLYKANLHEADLYKANLDGADLRGATLYGADLYDADLCGADLREANLYEANLNGAGLMNAKFYGKGGTSKLTKKQLPDFLSALGFQVEN